MKSKKIIKVLGQIIKWFFLIEMLIFVVIILSEILKSLDDKIYIYFLSTIFCGLIAYVGYRIERFGKSEKKSVVKPISINKESLKEKDVEEFVYKPISIRNSKVSNGKFSYTFKKQVDLFVDNKELAYPQLPGNFQIAANIGKHILDKGGTVSNIYIGGGSTEVSHTGSVAYSNCYMTLDSFIENSMKDLDNAHLEAENEYGSWFSSLDYKYIQIIAKIKEVDIEIEVSCFIQTITVSILLGNSEGFSYLNDLKYQFGAKDYHKGVGTDDFSWDSLLKVFKRTFQLEETKTFFLTSYMNEDGEFIKYSLDVETANDSHYEILPNEIEKLTQVLKEEMKQKYLQSPEVSCIEYLQHHSGWDLIQLLNDHHLIHQQFHY